ncbi:MAG: VPLPA-CTERM sorting domain-containing protein, partial [Gammaproteobacteria bacterium]|nr:VPLPA-CTERM sorting domain-containing protein [Gammaproteobacteria bacterium]
AIPPYTITTVDNVTSNDSFGIIGDTTLSNAITDNSVGTFVYVPGTSTVDTMTMSMSFNGLLYDSTGTQDLAFFFAGGDTSNSIDLSINGTTIHYGIGGTGTSNTLYSPQGNIYTATTAIGEYALSALFVDLNDFNLNGAALGSFDVTIGKSTYLSMIGTTSTISAVPVPAAVWLFVSGLLSIIGLSRRRRI